MPKATIEPLENGALRVRGIELFLTSQGDQLPVEGDLLLCRCGASKKKPYCDGAHRTAGFDGTNTADLSKNRFKTYTGRHLTIHDNRLFCCHISTCMRRSPDVFDSWRRPWIDPDEGEVEHTKATVELCPSGSLKYTQNGVDQVFPERPPAIRIEKNAGYEVIGGPEIKSDLQPCVPERYVLCRCGQARNKPYCDGRHALAMFRDDKN